MNKIQNIRGTNDIFGDEYKIFEHIYRSGKELAKKYSFENLETPIIEFSEIFERTIGESSDILNKEIYSFIDKGENKIALRPEFTASVMRAVSSNGLYKNSPLKLFSKGQVFRYDRPQKGRRRQFNQLNYEFIGIKEADPIFDAQMIFIACELLKMIGIYDFSKPKLHINSIGNKKTRLDFCEKLVEYLERYKSDLSEDTIRKMSQNPVRILDTKIEKEKEILTSSNLKISNFYDNESKIFFEKLCNYLDCLGLDYIVDDFLVRGLDYYNMTVFEIITDELGSQGTILAGGRYENLSEYFGLGKVSSFGFACGIERLCYLISNSENQKLERIDLYEKIINRDFNIKISILCIGEENLDYALSVFKKITSEEKRVMKNYSFEIMNEKKLQKMMEKANKNQSNYVIIIGENELKNKTFILKNLLNGEQKILELDSELENSINLINK